MGQLIIRAGIFVSILMFGFILGILYSDQDIDLTSSRFQIKEETLVDTKGYVINKEVEIHQKEQSNIIEMEDEEGLVVYKKSDDEIHKSLEEQLPSFVERSDSSGSSHSSPLFSEMGLRTAGAFEQVFQKMFSYIDGQ
ncbi:hypothetical protein ACM26V_24130 [Salipaludibacillus sp. HK11]|uniref:hypothetical protein n=1 Tax=Salipaludibacillus sp. HK11 TaxID=3394320 RepID=UPI0039FD375A